MPVWYSISILVICTFVFVQVAVIFKLSSAPRWEQVFAGANINANAFLIWNWATLILFIYVMFLAIVSLIFRKRKDQDPSEE